MFDDKTENPRAVGKGCAALQPAAAALQEDEDAPAPSAGDSAAAEPELSGAQWVSRFPCSVDLEALASPFRERVTAFYNALVDAGATISIGATLRPAERAFLMHYAFLIATGKLLPEQVPPHPVINIIWVHETLEQSRQAAKEMVAAYEIAYAPSLHSKHIDGRAVDMTISWLDDLHIVDGQARAVVIADPPRSGDNRKLQAVGRSYGVYKLPSDPPHWSDDGH